jgi:uncharacterized membrane protein
MDARTRKIVVTGVLGALSILLGLTPLGFVPWVTGASLTTMHIPVIIGAVLEGPVVGVVTGLIFGLFSLVRAAVAPQGPADVWFVNPLVSVAPRLFIGLVAWLVYASLHRTGARRIERKTARGTAAAGKLNANSTSDSKAPGALDTRASGRNPWQIAGIIAAGIAGSLTNTALVLGALGLLGKLPWEAIGAIAALNGLPEAALSAAVTFAVVVSWLRLDTRKTGSSL